MRLTISNIHHYLLDKGYITMHSLVDGDYNVVQTYTRNSIFKVIRKKKKSLFIKQLNSFDTGNTYVLQKDATCLWLIKNNPAFAQLSEHVPGYFGFDPGRQVLVTEYIADAISIEDYVRTNGLVPEHLLTQIASILASYHFPATEALQSSHSIRFFPKQVPWILTIAGSGTAAFTQASGQPPGPILDAVTQNPAFKHLMSGAGNDYTFTSLIHGDLKWINLLMAKESGEERVKIIDWEIADLGDPLWDVAGIMQGFITNALLYSNPNLAGPSPMASAPVTLTDLSPAWTGVRFFWNAYCTHASLDEKIKTESFQKAIRFTGARLVQTAVEHNMMMPAPQPNAIKILQAAYAVLSHTAEILQLLQFQNSPVQSLTYRHG